MKEMTTAEKDLLTLVDSSREILEAFRNRSVLVTGSTGLIGSMLVKTLLTANEKMDLNAEIYAHARSRAKAAALFGWAEAPGACGCVGAGDIPGADSRGGALHMIYDEGFSFDVPSCDYLFHAASPTQSKYFVEHPVEAIGTILDGTRSMLELARRAGAVMVYLSSMEEYGVPYEPGQIMTEDKVGVIDHLKPRSCYPEGKRMCECLCASYASEYGVNARIARLAQTFGAGIPLSDNRISMQFAKSALAGEDIVLHTEGRSVSNFCYLTDAVSGLLTIAARGEAGEAYNVCNDPESRTIAEIARLVADQAEREVSVVIDIPEGVNFGFAPDNTMRLNSDKLRSLGWEPQVSMAEGYRRLMSYLQEEES